MTASNATITALIAEEEQAWTEMVRVREEADQLYFPHRGRLTKDEDELYGRANILERAASALTDRVSGRVPETLADAIALLAWNVKNDNPDVIKNVLAGLRALVQA